jgi:ubiquinone/menaquinone biosynthesis C-methylase UbiE
MHGVLDEDQRSVSRYRLPRTWQASWLAPSYRTPAPKPNDSENLRRLRRQLKPVLELDLQNQEEATMRDHPFSRDIADNFQQAVHPRDGLERDSWQAANKSWWESNPMRYDFSDRPVESGEFSPEWFREVDRRFLRTVRMAFPWKRIPFDNFIDFDEIGALDVLEIGVGMGTHAELLSGHARSYTGIDLTEYSIRATKARFEQFGCPGRILQQDAELMDFPDASFDYVWSWGVIHHSSDTARILKQIHRVLRPGGKLVFMVYHQSVWNTFVRGWLYYGLLKRGVFRGKNAHQLIQETTDGALARYYKAADLKSELSGQFEMEETRLLGNKMQLLPLAYGPLKEHLARIIPDALGRWVTNRAFFAYMIVAQCQRVDK